MHKLFHQRRALNKQPIEVAASMLRFLAERRSAMAALTSAPYQNSSFFWPNTYEEGIRQRTYSDRAYHPRYWERADCGCMTIKSELYVDLRNHNETICWLHGNIVACAECGQLTDIPITPESEALSRRRTRFYCSDLCAANVAA